MENKEYPLEFLTEFIDRDGWIKLREGFIPKYNDPYKEWYNEEKESIEYEIPYVDEESAINPGEVRIYFSEKISDYFYKNLNSIVRNNINQYLYSRLNHEEKKRAFKLIIYQLKYFQGKILTKDGLNKYSQYIGLDSFIDNLQEQYVGLDIREVTPDEIQILQILEEFGNAVKKITQTRRKDHISFNIIDEYDVQDLLYVILKSVYPKLITEDPIAKIGSKSTKIDLILRGQGILIEVKIINTTGNSENKIIDDLKKDIESYHANKGLKTLICFVYDPQNLIKDEHNIKQLEGQRTKIEHTFEVKIVIQS